jgi:hypothetical protein
MGQDDKIHNPVEQYMKYIIDLDKPDKPSETVTEPTKHLEVKGSGHELSISGGDRYYALKIADAIKQSVNIKMIPKKDRQEQTENLSETLTFDVGHHPVGLIIIGLPVVVGYAAVFCLVSFLLPGFARLIGVELSVVGRIAGLSMLAMVLLGVMFLFFGAKNYLLNRLILTDFNIIHILKSGLGGKKAVELPMSDIENIIVRKTGILPSLFNYGTIIIETPQGQNNFVFKYAPDPDACAKAIHDHRLEYLANNGITEL